MMLDRMSSTWVVRFPSLGSGPVLLPLNNMLVGFHSSGEEQPSLGGAEVKLLLVSVIQNSKQ